MSQDDARFLWSSCISLSTYRVQYNHINFALLCLYLTLRRDIPKKGRDSDMETLCYIIV